MLISKDRLLASICKHSFYDFVQEFWDAIIPEDPVWNWHIKYLADHFQSQMMKVARGEAKDYDTIVNISPGTSKSTLASVMLPAWFWTVMPTARFICGSYAHMLALNLSRLCRLVVQSDKYRKWYPHVQLAEDQNTKGHFVTSAGGGRLAVGSGGSVTGFHAHAIIVDDPLDPGGSFSLADIKAVNNWMTETLPTRKVDKAVTPTFLIMQRLHQNDPTGHRLDRSKGNDIFHICLPAEETENIRPPELAENYIGGLMDPRRLSLKVLKENEKTLGQAGYAGQFLQTPIPRGGGAFQTQRIRIDTPPTSFVSKVRYWDKAGSADRGCYTAGVLMGKDHAGRFWWLDVRRGQWEAYEREQVILQTARMDGPGVLIGVEQEPGSGGKESAQNTLRNLAGFRVRLDRPVGDKAMRADPLAVQVNGENTSMVKGDWNLDLIDELRYFPDSKYKDQVDASSGSFSLLCTAKKRVGAL